MAFDGFPEELKGIKVIDADTHYSEPHNLWTSRVPDKYKTLVPHVADDGKGGQCWRFNGGELLFSSAGSASVIRKDGSKAALLDWDIQNGTMPIMEIHEASYDPIARMELMDAQGVFAHVIYPNVVGFGAHRLLTLEDQDLAFMILSVYNDAVAEMQEISKGRLFPQALIPFWNMDAALKEVTRIHSELKLTGITMSSEPHSAGLPDIIDHHWDPLWELCQELELPINFHVGSSEFGKEAWFKGVWPSLEPIRKHVVGCVLLEMHNARVLANLLTGDLLERFPRLNFVSVESGIGWILYVLERLEYQLLEQSLDGARWEQTRPTDLFHRQVYSCFWFEDAAPSRTLDLLGFDNVLFESDFPHPTCFYPGPVEHTLKVLEPWGAVAQRKVMSERGAPLPHPDLTVVFGTTAVTGIGQSEFYRAGRSPLTVRQLASIAVRNAIADAGLTRADIDGIVTYHDNQHDGAQLWSALGLSNLRYSARAFGGGGNGGGSAVQIAEAAISGAGYARHVLVYRAINQGHEGRYGRFQGGSHAAQNQAFLVPFGAATAVVKNALLISKYMRMHGISQEALADISLASYAHAQLNPRAVMYGRPLTREKYHASRWIAEPLHLYDCCQESDGACAIIVSSADRAIDLPNKPAYILAAVTGMRPEGGLWAFNDSDYPSGRLKPVGEQLWGLTGVAPTDVDVAQFYENFTGTTLIAISDIGFAPADEVEKFVSNGNIQIGGTMPLNTSGGNIAEAYIHGFQLMLEAVRQIRGTSTCQVDDVELSLFVAGPGTPPSSAVLLASHV